MTDEQLLALLATGLGIGLVGVSQSDSRQARISRARAVPVSLKDMRQGAKIMSTLKPPLLSQMHP